MQVDSVAQNPRVASGVCYASLLNSIFDRCNAVQLVNGDNLSNPHLVEAVLEDMHPTRRDLLREVRGRGQATRRVDVVCFAVQTKGV